MLHDMSTGGPVPIEAGSIARIALIGNFLPRRCGIATFTTHVHDALRVRYPDIPTDVYAMNDRGQAHDYPAAVVAAIAQDDIASYRQAAETILRRSTDLLWGQHEFGIVRDPDGHLIEVGQATGILA